jgi:penicillin amidase
LPPVPETNRGTYIQIVELSTPVRGSSILPPGQSEDPRSPHFSDQLPLSSWWRFKPMVTDRSQLATSDK